MEREASIERDPIRRFHLEGGIIAGILGFIRMITTTMHRFEKSTIGKGLQQMTK